MSDTVPKFITFADLNSEDSSEISVVLFSYTCLSITETCCHTLDTVKALKIVSESLFGLITERLLKTKFVRECLCTHISVCLSSSVCCFRSSVLIIDPGLSSFIRGPVKWRDGGAGRGSRDGAEVVIGLFRSPGLAQGHCETNSGPGLSLFLSLSPSFSHPFPPSHLPLKPPLFLSPPSFRSSSPSPGVFCHSRLVHWGAAEKWRG